MDCNNVCRLCDRLILSQAVTFAGGTLTINIPAGSYPSQRTMSSSQPIFSSAFTMRASSPHVMP